MVRDTSRVDTGCDIVCFGSLMVDLRGAGATPALDQVELFHRSLGAAAFNVASTIARLGRTAAVVGRVGDDAFGRFVRAELRRLAVDDRCVQVDRDHTTTLAFFAESRSTRDVLVVRGADRYLTFEADAHALIEQSAGLHVTAFALSKEPCRSATILAIETAHAMGRIVSLDPNYRAGTWRHVDELIDLLRHLLPLTTVIKPSLSDAEALWGTGLSPGDYVERFHQHGARQVLLTLGREGVVASDGVTIQRLPVVPIEASATSGVGDAFTAGALATLIDGQDLLTAARVGMLVADYRLRRPAYTGPLPRWTALRNQVKAGEDSDTPGLIQAGLPAQK